MERQQVDADTCDLTSDKPLPLKQTKKPKQSSGVKKDPGTQIQEHALLSQDNWVLLGADLSGIELRCLAHYLHPYDKGSFVEKVLKGDIHTDNLKALQKSFPDATRTTAKTAVYAFIYGAGDGKLGAIVNKPARGVEVRNALEKGIEGIDRLISKIKIVAAKNKKESNDQPYISGLDGRRLYIRSSHAALNTLLQGAMAVIMKKVTVLFHDRMNEKYPWEGSAEDIYNPPYWALQAHVHDEIQIKVRESIAKEAGEIFIQCTKEAGEYFNFKCPLDAEYKIGLNWAETH